MPGNHWHRHAPPMHIKMQQGTTGYKKDKVLYYFINPNYEAKFGLKPREQVGFISSIPFVRNFLITTSYYLVSPINNN